MKIKEFEQKIGYQFQNRNYLETALTHSSFNREKNTKHQDNERLEFLGDAFFDAVISVELYERLKHVTEGKLTKTRALIVCESALAQVARGYELGSYLNLGHGEDTGGGRHKDSILADSMEAVIGAIYLDGGYQAMQNFVKKSFSRMIDQAIDGKLFSDYKSEVQEILQGKGKPVTIAYETDREEGPAHDKTFFVHLSCNGEIMGKGIGKSKKEAEQNAAKQTLEMLERRK
ncbi:MAG: ribonuclease III [Clostridia bacterium]